MTHDEAEWEILKRANVKDKFAVPLRLGQPEAIQLAFERGLDARWYELIDISALSEMPGIGLCKIFRLTDKGIARRKQLQLEFGDEVGTTSSN